MTYYEISNTTSGAELGIYQGEDEAEAIEAMLEDANVEPSLVLVTDTYGPACGGFATLDDFAAFCVDCFGEAPELTEGRDRSGRTVYRDEDGDTVLEERRVADPDVVATELDPDDDSPEDEEGEDSMTDQAKDVEAYRAAALRVEQDETDLREELEATEAYYAEQLRSMRRAVKAATINTADAWHKYNVAKGEK